jgi:hypothetical protein
MRPRSLLLVATGCALLTACEGLKQALTAHVDVVARAASQELSVTRLADLMGNARIGIPATRENAMLVAQLWTGYQQLGAAAADDDSLNDKATLDVAAQPIFNGMLLQKFMDSVTTTFKADSGSEAAYAAGAGGLYAAKHILFAFPPAATAAQQDSVRKAAEAVSPLVTAANFETMAKKYSKDPGAANGGSLGVFQKAEMVPEFSAATAALKPGEISKPIKTQFGYHIIERLPYAEARAQFAQRYSQTSTFAAESTYMAQVDQQAGISVKDNAASTVRTAVSDLDSHLTDKSTVATFNGGDLTVAEFLNWLGTFPPNANVERQIPQAPDSVLKPFIKSIAEREVLLKRARDAKITVPDSTRTAVYNEFASATTAMWQAIGIDPHMLADSAKTKAERERLAASRVENFLDRVMAGAAQPIPVPGPIKQILDSKYESSINSAAVDKAVQGATKVRATSDSARAAKAPKSSVPLPLGKPPVTDSGAKQP